MTTTLGLAPSGVRVVLATADYTIGEYEGVMIVVWRSQPTVALFETRNAHLRELTSRLPRRCGLCEVIEASSPAPGPEARPHAMKIFPELKDTLLCIGFVMDNTALRTTLNRAVLTGMSFLMPQPIPSKVFKSVNALADWTREQMGAPLEAFNDAVAYLRQGPFETLQ